MYGLIQAKYLREEDPQRIAGRGLGVAFGLMMFAMAVWWRQWLEAHGFVSAQGWAIVAAAFGLTTATTFVIRRPYLMTVMLIMSAPLFLYLLSGEGPPKYAGLSYIGAVLAGWLVHRADRP